MSLRGVTAHGSPSGPLQFDRLEAALAAGFPSPNSILNSAKEKPEKAQIVGMDSPTSKAQARVVCAWLAIAGCHSADGNWGWRLGR